MYRWVYHGSATCRLARSISGETTETEALGVSYEQKDRMNEHDTHIKN